MYDFVTFRTKYEFTAHDAEGAFRDWDYESITLYGSDVWDFDEDVFDNEKGYWIQMVEESKEFEALAMICEDIKIIDIEVAYYE